MPLLCKGSDDFHYFNEPDSTEINHVSYSHISDLSSRICNVKIGKVHPSGKYVVSLLRKFLNLLGMDPEVDIQEFLHDFGKRIKVLRAEHNLTQLDLAVRTHMDIRQIQRIEAGDINTSIGNAF